MYEVRRIQTPDKNTSPAERFSWLLMNLPQMKEAPSLEIVGECGPMVKAARIAGFNREKKLTYVANMDKEHLERAIRHQNFIDGFAKGEAKGEAKGRAEGRAEANRETARNMLKMNLDISIISEVTGLTIEEIQALK